MSSNENDDPAQIGMRVRGANGQTANLFVVEQYDGTDVFKVSKDGYVTKQFDPDSASYIVWKSGSTYYAKSGANGSILTSGADFHTVLGATVTAMTSGGKIIVRDGTYTPASPGYLTISQSGITIEGETFGGVIFTDETIYLAADTTDFTLRNIVFNGAPTNSGFTALNGCNNLTIENVFVDSITTAQSGIYIYLSGATTIDNVHIRNVKVKDIQGHGFIIHGTSTSGVASNIWFEGCQAINCGAVSPVNEFIVGFDVSEYPALRDVFLVDCVATGCYESGFHIEPVNARNVQFVNCVSYSNAVKGSPTYGAGFMCPACGVHYHGCRSYDNENGWYFVNRATLCDVDTTLSLHGCSDIGSCDTSDHRYEWDSGQSRRDTYH